jgi:hypothetical protein
VRLELASVQSLRAAYNFARRGSVDDEDGRRIVPPEVREIFEILANGALQGAGAVLRIPARFDKSVLGGARELEPQLATSEARFELLELNVDDLEELAPAEPVEDDELIEPIDELRTEDLLRRRPGRRARVSSRRSSASRSCPLADGLDVGEPMLLVRMRTVFLKSTVRPCPSVSRPSSRTWRSTL